MNKTYSLIILLLMLVLVMTSCATPGGPAEEMQAAPGEAVIQYIDIFDNQVRVQVNKPFDYTIYKPGDPFRVIVELTGVSAGEFQDKIISNRAGITEINPVLVTEPSLSTKLEILLQNPSKIVPEMSGNLLALNVEAGEEVAEEPEMTEVEVASPVEEGAEMREEVPVEIAAEEGTGMGEAEMLKEPVQAAASTITDIDFERTEDAIKVVITADGDIKPDVLPLEGRLVLDFRGVEMQAQVPQEVAYPLKGIRWGKHDGRTRIVMDLMKKASYDVIAIDNSVVVSLSAPDILVPVAAGEAGPEEAEKGTEEIAAVEESVTAEGAIPPVEEQLVTMEEGQYRGKRISLDFQDADIIPIFRLFADVSGYNFVVSPKVSGKITMKLINVPWDQALDLVLRTHNLGKQIDGNIIRIATNQDLAKESEEKAKAKQALTKAKPLSTRVFSINYAGVDRISEAIKQSKIVSPRGSLTIDERASVVIINDVDETFAKVEDLIKKLDKPELQVRQVLIEARIVEATTSFARELGVQWGAFGQTTDGLLAGGGSALSGGTGMTGNNFVVNMPAGVGQGSGAAFGLGYLNAARTLALDLQLSALERKGTGKIISNPRIITMNNTAAKITQGRTIYVPVATSDKTDVKAIDANLTLEATPSIAPGGAILLQVKISKDEPGDIVAGNISVNRNNAETTTLINSGDTVVIGGIYKKSVVESDDGVPWLSKIPILGWLFQKNRLDETTSEILIFITPKVVHYDIPVT